MPLSTWIEYYLAEDFDYAMGLIYELTQGNTAEYCIRPFILNYYPETLSILKNGSAGKLIGAIWKKK